MKTIKCNKTGESWNTYREYIQSEEWSRKREYVLLVYKSCACCGSAIRLQVHHKTYDNIGNEKMDDMIVLCNDCHKMLHDNEIDLNDLPQWAYVFRV